MDSQVVQDLLPGTGSLGAVPTHHNYKRTVVRAPPKHFSVEVVPPRKFGAGYCYGLHILPHGNVDSSASSTTSGSSNTEYEVWRRWEDCLWFQDLIETEYKLMARTKRNRLAQGKGVKKNGVYLQSDGAASFDSLPPGPDANSIAKDVHDIIPKLTKKGTLFRASQATIEQRNREFTAMVHALFAEDVPSLVRELRENRIIRDFFGYWRRDRDHDRKANELAGANRASRASVTSSAFSMYFSSSNISLQLPNAFTDMPPSPAIPSPVKGKQRAVTKSASFSSSSSSSSTSRGGPQTPTSAPAGLSFTVSENGALIPTSPTSDGEDYFNLSGPSSAPLPSRPSSSRRSRSSKADKAFPPRGQDSTSESEDGPILFVPDSPWADTFSLDIHRPHNLEALPEEQELVPGMEDLTLATPMGPCPPVRRPRNLSCPDPHNRNGLVFITPPHGPVATHDAHDDVSIIDSIRADFANHSDGHPETPLTNSSSSTRTSMVLSNFSGELSRRSSWRTSMDSVTSAAMDNARESCYDIEDVLCGSPAPSFGSPLIKGNAELMHAPPMSRASVATMNSVMSNSSVDAVLPKGMMSPTVPAADLRRSLSAGSRSARRSNLPSPASVPSEEVWYDAGEVLDDELLDAYFYDPGLRPPSLTPSAATPDTPRHEHDFRSSHLHLSTLPRPSGHYSITSTPSSPRPSHISLSSVAPSSPSVAGDTFTIKAVRQDSIVLIRASHSMSLSDIRTKVREKFAAQEGIALTETFTISFNPAVTGADERAKASVKGRPRSQSTSALRPLGAQPRLRFLIYEEDWQQAAAACPGKMTLHVFDRF